MMGSLIHLFFLSLETWQFSVHYLLQRSSCWGNENQCTLDMHCMYLITNTDTQCRLYNINTKVNIIVQIKGAFTNRISVLRRKAPNTYIVCKYDNRKFLISNISSATMYICSILDIAIRTLHLRHLTRLVINDRRRTHTMFRYKN